MKYDEDLEQFIYEYEDLIFAWENRPDDNFKERVKTIANNYHDNFDKIVIFIKSNIEDIFDNVTEETVKNKLGKPIINYEIGMVTYCEQAFDSIHIFDFEFIDDDFEEIYGFSMDG